MKQHTILIWCAVAILLLVLVCFASREPFDTRNVIRDATSDATPHAIMYPAYQDPDDFRPSLLAHNPTVNGVSIVDRTRIFKQAALNGGILPIDAADQLLPPPIFKGERAWKADVGVIQNTLELSPTQEFQRAQLASAQTGYIPEDGALDNLHLWNSRTTIDKLQQPGFSVIPPSYSTLPYF